MEFIFPDYKNNIVNVSATLASFLGVETDVPQIEVLRDELAKGYKNVVFICIDGLGVYPLEQNLSCKDFLRKNVVQTLTTTFPSTTTNATSSMISAKMPVDHGWLAWCLY